MMERVDGGRLGADGSRGAQRRVRRPRVSHITLVLLMLLSVGASWVTGRVVRDQEHKLLVERSREVSLVLQISVSSISAQLTALRGLAADPVLFDGVARVDLAATPKDSIAALRPVPSGYLVVAAVGSVLRSGDVVTGSEASILSTANRASGMVATPVFGTGAARSLGFAVAAGQGLLVYRQVVVGEPHPPAQSATSPFSEVRVLLYASPTPASDELLLTTTRSVPNPHSVLFSPFMAGGSRWLLGVQAARPLVGSVANFLPWAVLVTGLIGAGLVFAVMESVLRRRNAALKLYESEHHFAETLQRRLLPTLESPPGLDVASRYVPASDNQRVGGDWFDVFPVGGGQVGVVIGDVMGHDVEAAAAMAQVRSALRAYAMEGGSPASVLDRLSRHIEAFEVAAIVTVIYGVLEPAGAGGSRLFRWANAGHLPPVSVDSTGVTELSDGTSPVLGAPSELPRAEGSRPVQEGSSLLLYTDGLVEVQGIDLAQSVDRLLATLADGAAHATADELCQMVLDTHMPDPRHDDIALIVVRNRSGAPEVLGAQEEVASAR